MNSMRAAAIFMSIMLITGCAKKPEYREAPVAEGEIVIDISSLKGKTPVFFSYHQDGRRYDFLVQSVEGEVRSYVDACFKCAPKKKGFEASGNRLRCRKCGESFPLENLSGIGSCYPIPLNGEVRGDIYVIKIEQLIEKTRYPL
jgi:uncharacterized membrane protein